MCRLGSIGVCRLGCIAPARGRLAVDCLECGSGGVGIEGCIGCWQDAKEADTWALQKKLPRPPKGLMFRYLEEAQKDGRVLPMSMVQTEGHSANVVEYKHDALERKLLSMSKGGSNNQRLLSAEQKKGLVPGNGLRGLPAGLSLTNMLPYPSESPKILSHSI